MDLNTRKYKFIQQLFTVEEEVFEKLEAVLKAGNENRISIAQYNAEIDDADNRISKGEFYTQEEVEKLAEKW